MKRFIFLLFALSYFCERAFGQDYCNTAQFCPYSGGPHIGCPGSYPSVCPPNTPNRTITTAQQSLILSTINGFRNKTACGFVNNLPKAKRMRVLTWNTELAKLANLNTRQCKMKHDKCRNTLTFSYSGQNLYMTWGSASINITKFFIDGINAWHAENSVTTANDIYRYPQNVTNRVIGHFTANVQDRSTQIGCGYTTWNVSSTHYALFACNFASTNIIGYPVYINTTIAASGCKYKHKTLKCLCNASEPINPNTLILQ